MRVGGDPPRRRRGVPYVPCGRVDALRVGSEQALAQETHHAAEQGKEDADEAAEDVDALVVGWVHRHEHGAEGGTKSDARAGQWPRADFTCGRLADDDEHGGAQQAPAQAVHGALEKPPALPSRVSGLAKAACEHALPVLAPRQSAAPVLLQQHSKVNDVGVDVEQARVVIELNRRIGVLGPLRTEDKAA